VPASHTTDDLAAGEAAQTPARHVGSLGYGLAFPIAVLGRADEVIE